VTDNDLALGQLSQLSILFREFSNGRHINRLADPLLWAELEREEEPYQRLFSALGYNLRLDGRGFAWFYTDDVSSNVSKSSRQLALLFMVIFDTQADAGKPLLRFSDWVIDGPLLAAVHEQHQDLLVAENLDVDGLLALLDTAARFGFARQQRGHWQLLPAVCRYLDHYEALATDNREETDPAIDDDDDDEEDVNEDTGPASEDELL